MMAKDKGIELKFASDDVIPLVHINRESIERAIINLINNAIKYTPNGGQVEVSVRAVPETKELESRSQGQRYRHSGRVHRIHFRPLFPGREKGAYNQRHRARPDDRQEHRGKASVDVLAVESELGHGLHLYHVFAGAGHHV
jgi:signal transduction histidine kinase